MERMRKHLLSKTYNLLLNFPSFWLNAFRDGDRWRKKVCEEWRNLVGSLPFCRPYCFQLLMILFSLLTFVNKHFKIFWYLMWYQWPRMSFEILLFYLDRKLEKLVKSMYAALEINLRD